MNESTRRVQSAAVLFAITVFAWIAGEFFFAAYLFVLSYFALREWNNITGANQLALVLPISLAASFVAHGAIYLQRDALALAVIFLAFVFFLLRYVLNKASHPQVALSLWGSFGAVVVLLPCISALWLYMHARPVFGFTLLCVWASDIGAYFIGRALGGPKLAPRISPGKTWSGSLGGLFTTVLVAYAFLYAKGSPWTFEWLVIAAIIAILSQAGDLGESALKRRFNVKDSGTLIPGHGGILDRIDGFLPVLPLIFLANSYTIFPTF